MTFTDSLMISLLGVGIVFLVLMLLSLLIKFQSQVLGYIEAVNHKQEKDKRNAVNEEETAATEVAEAPDEGWSAGELKLLGVDEKTAAMIMAIISHESQIPLSELQFKMIKAID
jgi:sodium pump decarboxylase gamma subunit